MAGLGRATVGHVGRLKATPDTVLWELKPRYLHYIRPAGLAELGIQSTAALILPSFPACCVHPPGQSHLTMTRSKVPGADTATKP